MPEPRAQLEDILRGVATDLYHVEEVLFLDDFMGRKADQINAATFGQFFGSLQIILGRFLVLQAARIFEQPNPRYPLRSIPSAIAVLRQYNERLAVEQRPGLIRALSRAGALPPEPERLSDPELTGLTAKFFEQKMSDSYVQGAHNARALLALKTVRDKTIAHPEAIRLDELPKSTFADIDRLMTLAKAFLGAVGFGYLSTAYEDDSGHYFMSSDARRSTVCLSRLLQKAGVTTDANIPV